MTVYTVQATDIRVTSTRTGIVTDTCVSPASYEKVMVPIGPPFDKVASLAAVAVYQIVALFLIGGLTRDYFRALLV